jgi:hypothetical protein
MPRPIITSYILTVYFKDQDPIVFRNINRSTMKKYVNHYQKMETFVTVHIDWE